MLARLSARITQIYETIHPMTSTTEDEANLPQGLYWLVDSPLFIDEDRINRFHDIVVNPLTDSIYSISVKGKEESESQDTTKGGDATGSVNAEGKLGEGLMNMLGSIGGGGSLEVSGHYERQNHTSEATQFDVTPTAPRQLAEISIYYNEYEQDRIFINRQLDDRDWRDPESITDTPRQLVYLELPSQQEAQQDEYLIETKLVPIAAEFEDGAVVPVYQTLIDKIYDRILEEASRDDDDEIPPMLSYPERSDYEDTAELDAKRHEYWDQFKQYFKPKEAIRVVEDAAKEHGRIDWIAFRLPLGADGKTLHLHIEPNGQYSNGTFAYNFIKRGQKHGMRLVGTMKSEPDMNVLAIYER